jgi:hypothetical protein
MQNVLCEQLQSKSLLVNSAAFTWAAGVLGESKKAAPKISDFSKIF